MIVNHIVAKSSLKIVKSCGQILKNNLQFISNYSIPNTELRTGDIFRFRLVSSFHDKSAILMYLSHECLHRSTLGDL